MIHSLANKVLQIKIDLDPSQSNIAGTHCRSMTPIKFQQQNKSHLSTGRIIIRKKKKS